MPFLGDMLVSWRVMIFVDRGILKLAYSENKLQIHWVFDKIARVLATAFFVSIKKILEHPMKIPMKFQSWFMTTTFGRSVVESLEKNCNRNLDIPPKKLT